LLDEVRGGLRSEAKCIRLMFAAPPSVVRSFCTRDTIRGAVSRTARVRPYAFMKLGHVMLRLGPIGRAGAVFPAFFFGMASSGRVRAACSLTVAHPAARPRMRTKKRYM
jgi:hypothetical protein